MINPNLTFMAQIVIGMHGGGQETVYRVQQ